MTRLIFAAGDDYPNVVRLNVPTDRNEEGAAWIYVPSKDTIYIGAPGSVGSTIELSTAVKSVADVKKGEKLVSGVMYDDGYSDYFQDADKATEGKILLALQNYHQAYYDEEDNFRGQDNRFHNYPTEDSTDFDPEDDVWDRDENAYEVLDPDTGQWTKHKPTLDKTPGWMQGRDWSGKGDFSVMKPTPGSEKHIHDWTPEDYLNWREEGRKQKMDKSFGYSSWGSTREDYNHWRWSFGDSNLVAGPPHEGLWVWPTEYGYPDHFSQTGTDGLGNCSQGRIYPHVGDRWEILTWPERPRNIKDPLTKETIQHEAQQAVKNYLIEKVGVPEDKIFFTIGGYGDMVSYYNSPSYPGESKSSPYSGTYSDFPDASLYGDATPKSEWQSWKQQELHYDDDDGSSYYVTYDPATQTTKGTGPFFEQGGGYLQKVIDKLHPNETPEEKYERKIREYEQSLVKGNPEPPEGTSTLNAGNEKYVIYNNAGQKTVVSEADYERAVEEYGDQHWYLAFLSPKEVGESDIEKVGKFHDSFGDILSNLERDIEEQERQDGWEAYLSALSDREKPVGATMGERWHDLSNKITDATNSVSGLSKEWRVGDDGGLEYVGGGSEDSSDFSSESPGQISYGESSIGGKTKTDAFIWFGFGKGEDEGKNEDAHPELITGTTHWTIVNRVMKTGETISEFLQNGLPLPTVWGYVTVRKATNDLIVTFLTHLGEEMQNLEFMQDALVTISAQYHMPVADYDVQDSENPILESYTPTGVTTTKQMTENEKGPPLESPDPSSEQSLGSGVIARNEIGKVVVTTEYIGKFLFFTSVQGGDLDGQEFRTYSKEEALKVHNTIVRDESGAQAKFSREAAMKKDSQTAFRAIEVTPPEEAGHSENERPFLYYSDNHTLYYTTEFCHHYNIVPLIVELRAAEGNNNLQIQPITGDITDPTHDGRNWIKFINGNEFPTDIVDFLWQKFGFRDVKYSGESGWENVAPHQFYIKKSAIIEDTPRKDRLAEWRWSYDPDTEEFKVWEVSEGVPSHADVTGPQGAYLCVQGRIYLLKDKIQVFYWKDRPYMLSTGEEKSNAQERGWNRAWEWIEEQGLENQVATKTAAMSSITNQVNWMWSCAYSPYINAPGNLLVTHNQTARNVKLSEQNIDPSQATLFKLGTVGANNLVYQVEGETLPQESADLIKEAINLRWGEMPVYDYNSIVEAEANGESHPINMPNSGCFGFINGNLILGSRHHQEIMYRLLEHGWSWDDLLNAKQCWGWFNNHQSDHIEVYFSSDAGIMTSKKVKDECKATFGNMYNKPVEESEGYGGKSKETFGGDFAHKYGDPSVDPNEMEGYKTTYDSSIMSPLPPPPAKAESEITPTTNLPVINTPGGGKAPPKKEVAPKKLQIIGPGNLIVGDQFTTGFETFQVVEITPEQIFYKSDVGEAGALGNVSPANFSEWLVKGKVKMVQSSEGVKV